jgi:hypothetical protein
MKRDVGWETANMEGQTRTCSEINEPGGTGGERSVEELGCCGLTSLHCDEMRKHEGDDETTQRRLDGADEVVAV